MLQRSCRVGFLVLLLAGSASAERDATAPQLGLRDETPRRTALIGATIVPRPGERIEHGTLILRDGRIEAIGGPESEVPADAVTVSLEGMTVHAGLIDPYTEYGLEPTPRERPRADGPGRSRPQYEAARIGGNGWNEAVRSHLRAVEAFRPDPEQARTLIERGVTTVMSLHHDGIFRGRAFVASLDGKTPNEQVLRADGPQGMSFSKGSSNQAYPSSLMGSIALIRQTLLDARWYAAAGAAAEYDRTLEALAGDDGPFLFESDNELDLLRAERLAREAGIRLVHVGSNTEYRRPAEILPLERSIVLPLDFPERPEVDSYEDALDVSLTRLRLWERAPGNAATLVAGGARVAFTAYGLEPGDDPRAAIRRAMRAGLSEEAALAAVTTVPAEIAGIDDVAGTLEPGKRADLVVTDGPLFDEETRIREVWIDGRRVAAPLPADRHDFRGRYVVRLDGLELALTLEGRLEAPDGKLQATGEGETREEAKPVPIGGVEGVGPRLSFRAPLDDLGGRGVARFTLHWIDGALSGRATLADGRRVDLSLEPAAADGSSRDDVPGRSDDRTPVSRITAPDAPFGFDMAPEPEDVLIRGATVWTGSDRGVLEGADLLVRGGKIAAVGPGLDAPRGVTVIDGQGLHLTAGMIDEHSHIAISRGVNEGSHAVTAEVRIGDVVDPDDVSIYRALAGGTTAAQLLHGSANPIGGQAQVIKLRWGRSAEAMKFDAAPPTIKFALGENVKQSNWGDVFTERYPQTRMGVETMMRDAFLAARRYGERRRAWEALTPGQREGKTAPRRDLQLEALDEILRSERFVHCHSYHQTEILMLMRLAEELGFRIQTFTHILEGYKVAPEMARHGAMASTFSDWWAYKFEVYDAIPYNTCLMQDAGVVVSINSDSEELIRRLNQEAGKSVLYCGMDPQEALKLATLNPARQLRVDDRVGSLEPGKDADFVVWSGPPLSMRSRVLQTWIDGTRYFDVERDAELRDRDAAERQALIQKALRSNDEGEGKRRRGRRGDDRNPSWHCDDVEDVWHE